MFSAFARFLLAVTMLIGMGLSLAGLEAGTILLLLGLVPSASFLLADMARVPLSDVRSWQWIMLVIYAVLGMAIYLGKL